MPDPEPSADLPELAVLPRRLAAPPLALGGALLWGVVELLALWRTRGVRRAGDATR